MLYYPRIRAYKYQYIAIGETIVEGQHVLKVIDPRNPNEVVGLSLSQTSIIGAEIISGLNQNYVDQIDRHNVMLEKENPPEGGKTWWECEP